MPSTGSGLSGSGGRTQRPKERGDPRRDRPIPIVHSDGACLPNHDLPGGEVKKGKHLWWVEVAADPWTESGV
jgi:hypothetical protein